MKTFGDDLPQYVLASFKDRFLALFLDVSIVLLISFPLSLVLSAAEAITMAIQGTKNLPLPYVFLFLGLRMLVSLGVGFFYYGYFYKRRGTSLGKGIMNLRIVCLPHAQNPSYKTAFVRDLFGKMLSALPFCVGYLMVLFRQDRRALHDLVGDTLVLKRVR